MSPPSSSVSEPEPIAIVGISCRLPGDIRNPRDLYDLLSRKESTFSAIPSSRFHDAGFYHPTGVRQGSLNNPGGHFITSPSIASFDPGFFGIRGVEADSMDPQQRILLECVWECFETAGVRVDKLRGERVGVYVGGWSCDYADIALKEPDLEPGFWITGGGRAIWSNRVSYVFDFKGPSMTLDTGCSASGMALHTAIQALLDPAGKTHSAIVGGTNLFINPEMAMSMSSMGVLSPTGPCKTFDEKADGYARGEGVNVIYLKRLSDALRDRDPIRALIRGSAVNSDGKTLGLAAPSTSSQEECIREAYARAGITDFSATAYLECHGTGTPAGDPVEVAAAGGVFGINSRADGTPLYIGSIKTNLGHAEGASALSGVIKGVVSLEGGRILPNLWFEKPNPKIHLDLWNFKVPTEVVPWPSDKAKRVSVSSYGYGGANFHVILESLEEYARSHPQLIFDGNAKQFLLPYENSQSVSEESPADSRPKRPFLLTFSAKSEEILKAYMKSLAAKFATSESSTPGDMAKLADLAYTLSARRSLLPVKAFGVVNPTNEASLAECLQELAENARCYPEPQGVSRIGFVFTGQGAQWAQMGLSLLTAFPIIAKTLESLEKVLEALPDPPQWTIREELRKGKDESRINEPQFAQVLCTAIQIALVDLFRSWGVKPRAVVGHSSGEVAAAYAAGILTAEDAIIVSYYRGKICRQMAGLEKEPRGGMLAVGLGEEEIAKHMEPFAGKLVVGCVNSPGSVTISGDVDAIEQLQKNLELLGEEDNKSIFCRRLKVPLAYHSHHMSPFGQEYEHAVESNLRSRSKVGICPMFSSVTAGLLYGKTVKAGYWRQNLESSVKFSQAVQAMVQQASVNTLIEIGPHSALSGPIREIRGAMKLGLDQLLYIPTLIRGEDSSESVLRFAGILSSQGYTAIDLEKVSAVEYIDPVSGDLVKEPRNVVVDLPTYAWDHSKEYWCESRRSKEWRFRKHPRHDLLGSKVTGTDVVEWQWMNVISAHNAVWLRDHKAYGNSVMPAVGYVSMAIEAITQILETRGTYDPSNAYYLREIFIHKALMLDERPHASLGTELYTTMRPSETNREDLSIKWFEFTIRSTGVDGAAVKHCSGYICSDRRKPASVMPSTEGAKLRELSSEKLYRAFANAGFDYGPRFMALKDMRVKMEGNEMWAKMDNHNLSEAWWVENSISGKGEEEETQDGTIKPEPVVVETVEETTVTEPLVATDTATNTSSDSSSQSSRRSSFSVISGTSSLTSGDQKSQGNPDEDASNKSKAPLSLATSTFFRRIDYSAATTTSSDSTDYHIDSRYPIHPINLDISIQLIFATLHSGRLSTINDITVPVMIEELYVATPDPNAGLQFDLYCDTIPKLKPVFFGENECIVWDSTGQEVIRVSQVTGMEVGGALHGEKRAKMMDQYRLEWFVDWSFLREEEIQGVVEMHLPDASQANSGHAALERQYFLLLLAAECLHLTEGIEIPGESPAAHLQRYKCWLQHILSDDARISRLTVCGGGRQDPTSLSSSHRQEQIALLLPTLPAIPEVQLAYKFYRNISNLFSGEIEPLELLSQDGLLDALDDDKAGTRMSHHLTALAKVFSRKYPKADVLQLGGVVGSGGQAVLQGMTADLSGGLMERRYGSFTYTTSESNGLEKIQERFAGYSGVEVVAFDVNKEIEEQGLNERKFDIVFAVDSFRGTENLEVALSNVAKLLRPGGILVLSNTIEGELGHLDFPFIMGTLPTWWQDGEEHCQPSTEEWATRLQGAGFQELYKQDDLDNAHLNSNNMMVLTYVPKAAKSSETDSQESIPPTVSTSRGPVVLLYRNSITPSIEAIGFNLATTLKTRPLYHMSLHSAPQIPQDSLVISLLELDSPFLTNATAAEFETVKSILGKLIHHDSYLLWVTSGAHLLSQNPEMALINGLFRSLRNELGFARVNTLDLSSPAFDARVDCISRITTMLSTREVDVKTIKEQDWEFAEWGSRIYVPRMVVDNKTRMPYVAKRHHQSQTRPEPFHQEGKNLGLVCGQRGLLNALMFKEVPVQAELFEDQVEIKCEAFGLNFKDVATALGVVPFPYLGTECSGTITRVGTAVTRLKVGDRVMVMATNCFMSRAVTWEGSCVKIPEALENESLVDVMACNVVFATAIMSLIHCARLKKGEKVLIHSAAGGVGLAAIQIANMIGAEIFATCGSVEKRKFLTEEHHIPDDHIFSSRDTSFSSGLMKMTKGKGVDVILNSLSGDLLQESWRCIGKFGRFIEIGKREMLLAAKISMRWFLRSSSFTAVDLGELWLEKHPLLTQLMEETLAFWAAGLITPIRPVKEFNVTELEQAFRYMSTGTHTGKIVITANPDSSAQELVKVSQTAPPVRFDSHASYVLVGGLGGVGSSLAVWMAENGARHLCLMTRSPKPTTGEAQKALRDLEAMGCEAQLMHCDVGDAEAVEKAIQSAELPIRGVIHAAMSLRDGLLEKMTHSDFNEPLRAKVTGLMNLHNSLASQPLKFFVVLSSVAAVLGCPGQTNYAAAGAFQDAFVRYRHRLGLPATAVDLGTISEIGYVSRNSETEKRLRDWGFKTSNERQIHQLVRMAIDNPHPGPPSSAGTPLLPNQFTGAQLVTGLFINDIVHPTGISSEWVDDPKWHIVNSTGRGLSSDSGDSFGDNDHESQNPMRDFATRTAEEVVEDLCTCIIRKTAALTSLPREEIKKDDSLKRYGMDSLVAVEMKNWLVKVSSVELAVADILNAASITGLAEKVYAAYKGKVRK